LSDTCAAAAATATATSTDGLVSQTSAVASANNSTYSVIFVDIPSQGSSLEITELSPDPQLGHGRQMTGKV